MSKLRASVTALRAQLDLVLGRQEGFFVPYCNDHAIDPSRPAYPEIERMCSALPFEAFLDDVRASAPRFLSFEEELARASVGRGLLSVLDRSTIFTGVTRGGPRRIIAIGGGDPTCFVVAAARGAEVTVIDPHPDRYLRARSVELVERILKHEDAQRCDELEADDILFIDSSHIMLPGMDVDIQFNRCFPRLRSGVLVYLHSIFLPFDYPARWRARNYSEQNSLISWIASGFFEIVFPANYVVRRHGDLVRERLNNLPLLATLNASSLWLRKG